MISMNRFAGSVQRFFEATSTARLKYAIVQVNTVLLGMGRERVEELGYSYEALQIGPSAWPWRNTFLHSASNKDNGGTVVELKKANIDKTDRSSGNHVELDQTAA